MTAPHRRIAFQAMTNHEFLDAAMQQERATYADGTTVTVDWNKKTVVILPALR